MKNNYKSKEDIAVAREIISCPGDTLAEHLEYMGMSQAELAERMGRPKKTINEIIQGKAQITPETALQLERVVGISATFWMNLEHNYRLLLAELDEAEKRIVDAEWAKQFPLQEMIDKGWITVDNGCDNAINTILSFFKVATPQAYQNYCHNQLYATAYRMSETCSKDPHAVAAWLRQGERQAEYLKAVLFDRKKFEEMLLTIKKLIVQDDNFFEALQDCCLQAGVKVVHTPCLKKAPLNGSTRWINDSPLIQLSNRFNRNDIFWFTFFHEAAHIIKHNKKDVFIEGMDYSFDGKKKEDEANMYAEEYLISRKEENELLASTSFQKDDIQHFAEKFSTHPAVVIGRLVNKGKVKAELGHLYGFYKKVELH
uniref:Putative plasmid maintenance system antidote protein, XRE family n=1 Tax=Chlorobium chlorochromatii (strain CaD3) TaxID=340177 RepID=Q3ARB9_CHLCH